MCLDADCDRECERTKAREFQRRRRAEEAFILGAKAGEFDLPEPIVGGSRAGLPDHALPVSPRLPKEGTS